MIDSHIGLEVDRIVRTALAEDLGLDPTARRRFYDALLRDYAEHPRTILMSTHLIGEVEGASARAAGSSHQSWFPRMACTPSGARSPASTSAVPSAPVTPEAGGSSTPSASASTAAAPAPTSAGSPSPASA